MAYQPEAGVYRRRTGAQVTTVNSCGLWRQVQNGCSRCHFATSCKVLRMSQPNGNRPMTTRLRRWRHLSAAWDGAHSRTVGVKELS